jgi:hypothetical protein
VKARLLRAVSLLALLLAAGCSGAPQDPRFSPVAFDGAVPQFVGPWAVELTDLYASSKSDLEREVLADEQITEEEYQALEDWYIGCMAGQGLTVTPEEFGYDLGTEDQDAILTAEGVCKTDTMSTALWMMGNPDNVPGDQATYECMLRHGDLEPGFSFEDFTREMTSVPMSEQWIALMGSEQHQACAWDPMDLLGMYPTGEGT